MTGQNPGASRKIPGFRIHSKSISCIIPRRPLTKHPNSVIITRNQRFGNNHGLERYQKPARRSDLVDGRHPEGEFRPSGTSPRLAELGRSSTAKFSGTIPATRKADPRRFRLSAGHGSMFLYSLSLSRIQVRSTISRSSARSAQDAGTSRIRHTRGRDQDRPARQVSRTRRHGDRGTHDRGQFYTASTRLSTTTPSPRRRRLYDGGVAFQAVPPRDNLGLGKLVSSTTRTDYIDGSRASPSRGCRQTFRSLRLAGPFGRRLRRRGHHAASSRRPAENAKAFAHPPEVSDRRARRSQGRQRVTGLRGDEEVQLAKKAMASRIRRRILRIPTGENTSRRRKKPR
jgi:hypothetical protein